MLVSNKNGSMEWSVNKNGPTLESVNKNGPIAQLVIKMLSWIEL